jgi:hypothetical protein
MAKRLLTPKLHLLSARQVCNAREAELSDGGGLLLRCSGAQAAWVFRYTGAAGKRREMGLGTCARHSPQAAGESLGLARKLAAQARGMLANNPPLDPIDERAKERTAAREAERRQREDKRREKLTLARAARTYHEKFIEPWRRPTFATEWIHSLENHVPPALWHKPIAEITRAELLDFLRDIQHRMADTAQRVAAARRSVRRSDRAGGCDAESGCHAADEASQGEQAQAARAAPGAGVRCGAAVRGATARAAGHRRALPRVHDSDRRPDR